MRSLSWATVRVVEPIVSDTSVLNRDRNKESKQRVTNLSNPHSKRVQWRYVTLGLDSVKLKGSQQQVSQLYQ